MQRFINWLNNAAIQKKFIPLQCFIIACVILISAFSFFSVATVNISSRRVIDENVRHKEQLSSIIRTMYVCRVLGRDILFQQDEENRNALYEEYINAFNDLDYKMDEYTKYLSGSKLDEFERIIQEKNVYKDSMILSADIWIGEGDYDEALYALQIVTPIANEFFGSIDEFSNQEEQLLKEKLENNNNLVLIILVSGVIINVVLILAVVLFIKFFSKSMSTSLVKLEKSMSKIAETGNMKTDFPQELYTNDEVGRIAGVANKMKDMLLEYSFNDTLTGGLNVKAYHEELNDLFADETEQKEIWCVISDMNNLKLLNDHLGHMEGDNAIRNSCYSLNNIFNQYGKTFRIGGDEFVSLLAGCTKDEIETMISKIVDQIDKANNNSEFRFSLAFGFDLFIGNTILEYKEFFKTVDKKMYDNKLASKQSRLNARVVELPEHEK